MRCPDCNKEIGNSPFCPYCGTKISLNSSPEQSVEVFSEKETVENKKSKLIKAFISFLVSILCILLWSYLINENINAIYGSDLAVGFSYAFKSKLIIIFILGLFLFVFFSFSKGIDETRKKIFCIITCAIFSVISFFILFLIKGDGRNINEYIEIYNNPLSIYLALCIPLLFGSLFLSLNVKDKKRRIIYCIFLALFCVVLSSLISRIFIHNQGFHFSISISSLAPIITFIISINLK